MKMLRRETREAKREWVMYGFLSVLTLFVCWLFVGRYGVFGAKVDWISQHSVLPDYFRQQFYETGDLFPEFAANLGGGQNIYNFSYYGLYSPVVLISYLLPFVKMGDYLMAASIAELILSVWLMYYWLGRRGFPGEIRLTVTVMFLLAGPMIYQSCHQVMFVNYMPFLCMAFLGMDRYLEQRKTGLYTIGVFLMIMTSFYFSIGGMLALVLYGVSRYLELRGSCKILIPMVTAVLMSGILLAPTAFAILGRQGSEWMTGIWSTFIPDISVLRLTYSGYGVGLTTLVFTVLIVGLTYQKWHERVLTYGCVLIFTIPFFSWILNGGLYVRDKALIPFLPLLCYLTAVYLQKQKRQEISFRVSITAYSLTLLLLCYGIFCGKETASQPVIRYLILGDGILMMSSFLIFWKGRRMSFLLLPSVLCLFLSGSILCGVYGEVADRETYEQVTDKKTGQEIREIFEGDDGFYRVEQGGGEETKAANLNRIWDTRQWVSSIYSSAYNAEYHEFRKEIFGLEEPFRNDLMQAASDNPLFQKLMGVKYVVNGREIRKNETVAPIAYATDRLITQKEYDRLDFPYNQTALMRYVVVQNSRSSGDQWKEGITDMAAPSKLSLPESNGEALTVETVGREAYRIRAEKKTSVQCKVPKSGSGKEQLFYLRFEVKNHRPGQDVAVWFNGIRNKLSAGGHFYYNGNTVFTYVTTLEAGQSEVELTFGKGDYGISNIECFLGDIRVLEDRGDTEGRDGIQKRLYQSEFEPDWEKTKGNRIQGKIQVERTGYFVTSIPYDSGFEIHVDGKRTACEKVNHAFLGFPIAEGEHQVEIIYHAQGVKIGKILSCLGILLWMFHMGLSYYKSRARRCEL